MGVANSQDEGAVLIRSHKTTGETETLSFDDMHSALTLVIFLASVSIFTFATAAKDEATQKETPFKVPGTKNRRICGRKLVKHLKTLCDGECYGDSTMLPVYGCAISMSDEDLAKNCCPDGPSSSLSRDTRSLKDIAREEYLATFDENEMAISQGNVRQCGKKVTARVFKLCQTGCYNHNEIMNIACVTGISDEQIIKSCCPSL